jgi:hypothetical protein
MDVGLATGIIVTTINVIGWGYTKIYGFGKLNGRVDNLEKTSDRHEKLLTEDGLIEKINNCSNQIAGLDGTVKTYIELTKDRPR